jgi:hypothetical protein
MLRRPPALFGTYVRSKKFLSRPALLQCDRCHRLGHSLGRCPRPTSLIVCALCGGAHTVASHPYHCAAKSHKGKKCDCPVSCFLCKEKKQDGQGHHARSNNCPLRAHYRSDTSSRPLLTSANITTPPPPATGTFTFTLIPSPSLSPAALAQVDEATPVLLNPNV